MVEKYLNVEEAAEKFRIAKGTLYNWVYQKKIPYRKMGKRLIFVERELDECSKSFYTEDVLKTTGGVK